MNKCIDHILSAQLQELFLQNKHWYSDILFFEDESRFFYKIFDWILPTVIEKDQFLKVQYASASLGELESRRNKLKAQLKRQQHLLETMIKDMDQSIGLNLISQNMDIVDEIKTLFISDKLIKKKLFIMVEETMREQKAQLINLKLV